MRSLELSLLLDLRLLAPAKPSSSDGPFAPSATVIHEGGSIPIDVSLSEASARGKYPKLLASNFDKFLNRPKERFSLLLSSTNTLNKVSFSSQIGQLVMKSVTTSESHLSYVQWFCWLKS